jgi:hypothetical protein
MSREIKAKLRFDELVCLVTSVTWCYECDDGRNERRGTERRDDWVREGEESMTDVNRSGRNDDDGCGVRHFVLRCINMIHHHLYRLSSPWWLRLPNLGCSYICSGGGHFEKWWPFSNLAAILNSGGHFEQWWPFWTVVAILNSGGHFETWRDFKTWLPFWTTILWCHF